MYILLGAGNINFFSEILGRIRDFSKKMSFLDDILIYLFFGGVNFAVLFFAIPLFS